ncbi:MAG: hypothetical protein AAF412_02725 [Pseudomonadota bacterium]
MTDYSDAALLKGHYAPMLKEPPKEAEWKKTACDSGSEEMAQTIAKQIFGFQQSIDPELEKLEVITFSALGPIKVMGISPLDGDLMRIDGINPADQSPISIIQHAGQLSLTFTKASVHPDEEVDDDGLQIGYVIFDELKERKKQRDAARRKRTSRRKKGSKS